jgi:transposase-like protein
MPSVERVTYANEIVHPMCPRCHSPTWLSRVEAEDPGHDKQTFECQLCGTTTTVMFEYK